jgi:hypothetical protein
LTIVNDTTISLITSVVLDNNGHAVPDNTTVDFVLTSSSEGVISTREVSAVTRNGIAQVSFSAETSGLLQVHAQAGDPAGAISNTLQFDVTGLAGDSPFVVVTATNEPSGFSPIVIAPDGQPGGSNSGVVQPNVTGLGHWLLSLLMSLFVSLIAFQALAGGGEVRWGVRGALAALIGGQVVSTYLGFKMPGTSYLLSGNLIWGVILSTLIGAMVGWVLSHVWRMYSDE